jgi:hypothetical protein
MDVSFASFMTLVERAFKNVLINPLISRCELFRPSSWPSTEEGFTVSSQESTLIGFFFPCYKYDDCIFSSWNDFPIWTKLFSERRGAKLYTVISYLINRISLKFLFAWLSSPASSNHVLVWGSFFDSCPVLYILLNLLPDQFCRHIDGGAWSLMKRQLVR